MKKIWSWLILGILVIFIAVFFVRDRSFFDILFNLRLIYLIPLVFASLVIIVLNGLQIKYLTRVYGINLSVKEWFGLSVVNTMANYMAPFRSGSSVKAIYLKKVHGLAYSVGLTIIGGVLILSLLLYSLLGVFVSWFYDMGYLPLIIFMVSFLGIMFVIFLLPSIPSSKNKVFDFLIKSINALKDVRKQNKIMIQLLIVNFLILVFTAISIFFSFKAINYPLSFEASFVISLFATLSLIISVTPASLGIRESIITLSAKQFGVVAGAGLSAAIIDRVVFTFLIFILSPIFSYVLLKQKKIKLG